MNTNAALILIYHRVAELDCDPQWLGVPPGQFDEQMAVLARRWRPVELGELADAVRAGDVPDGAVAVTFDDGYADNWTHAVPILKRYGVPATIFVTTHGDAPGRELWWDELERLTLGSHSLPRRVTLQIDREVLVWDLDREPESSDSTGWNVAMTPDTPRRRLYAELHDALRVVRAETRWHVLEQLRAVTGLSPAPRASHRLMSNQEIAEAFRSGLIDIGAHTVTHPVLATLATEDQRWELAESRGVLAEITGGPVSAVSYPYGGRRDYSATTIEIAESLGFLVGCANHAGCVTRDSNVLALPRVLVRDWDGDEFERRIECAFLNAGRTHGHPASQHV